MKNKGQHFEKHVDHFEKHMDHFEKHVAYPVGMAFLGINAFLAAN